MCVGGWVGVRACAHVCVCVCVFVFVCVGGCVSVRVHMCMQTSTLSPASL
jgi:hypothetical protein